MRPQDKEERVMVAIGEPMEGTHGPKTVILGMPEQAWTYMDGGLTHTFDLTKIGIPVQIVIFRAKDHDDVKRQLAEVSGVLDSSNATRDLGIAEPSRQ